MAVKLPTGRTSGSLIGLRLTFSLMKTDCCKAWNAGLEGRRLFHLAVYARVPWRPLSCQLALPCSHVEVSSLITRLGGFTYAHRLRLHPRQQRRPGRPRRRPGRPPPTHPGLLRAERLAFGGDLRRSRRLWREGAIQSPCRD